MTPTLAPAEARALFARMRERSVLVVGDIMVDEWIWGTVTRISPEAPVPVVAVTDHSFTLGGAGNVAHNLRALGANVTLSGASGSDAFGDAIAGMLRTQGIGEENVVRVSDRPTTRKTRVVAHSQQVVRADWESTAALSAHQTDRLCEVVAAAAATADAVVLSDYAKGLFSRELVEAALCCPLVLADPKPKNLRLFSGVTCVAPNAAEVAEATGMPAHDETSVERAGAALIELLNCRYVVITRGEHGMSLVGSNGERLHVPSVAHTVFDVSGAGDTVIAALSLALAAGAPIERAMTLANVAAGVVVSKLGTATASEHEILAMLDHATPAH
ncbi:MAG: D-glycero-beta-D-manno-heptose-7-phosphate kinase [Candidatus Eremiobacteraeota bacterium]|nr:D-glycero-beta-D-manno-heptose-7-phosphate kinase [Candidatus Eremiobacteraeota bacterium]